MGGTMRSTFLAAPGGFFLRPYSRGFLTCAICLLLALALPFRAYSEHRKADALYVSFLDQLPPQGVGPSINGLDERRRGPIFQSALNAASAAGELPRLVFVNRDISLPSTQAEEGPVPPGGTLVRIYLTQWSRTRLGGFATSEILCRIFAEVVRDGRRVKRLGPFLGRETYDQTTTATGSDRYAQFEKTARLAVDALARQLR